MNIGMGRLAALESKKWRSALVLAGAGACALTYLGLGGTAPAASASGVDRSPLVKRIPGAVTPLPDCAVTYVPKVGHTGGRRCVEPAASSSVGRPSSPRGCSYAYYQNGPYGSQAWRNGWGFCVTGNGPHWVLGRNNDQASSWDSCSWGYFYANEPGTSPYAQFPANSAGNFPLGGVRNDSLSSAWSQYKC